MVGTKIPNVDEKPKALTIDKNTARAITMKKKTNKAFEAGDAVFFRVKGKDSTEYEKAVIKNLKNRIALLQLKDGTVRTRHVKFLTHSLD